MEKSVKTATVQVAIKKKKQKPNLTLSFEASKPQSVSYGVVSKTTPIGNPVGNGRMTVCSLTVKLSSLGLKAESKRDLLMLEFTSKSYHWSMRLKKKELSSIQINGEEQWDSANTAPLSGSQLENLLSVEK